MERVWQFINEDKTKAEKMRMISLEADACESCCCPLKTKKNVNDMKN